MLIVISVAVLRPGRWTTTRWVGLGMAVPGAVLLFVARWQYRELVTHGLYSKIRNPIDVFSALMPAGILIVLQRPYALLSQRRPSAPVKESKVLEAAGLRDRAAHLLRHVRSRGLPESLRAVRPFVEHRTGIAQSPGHLQSSLSSASSLKASRAQLLVPASPKLPAQGH